MFLVCVCVCKTNDILFVFCFFLFVWNFATFVNLSFIFSMLLFCAFVLFVFNFFWLAFWISFCLIVKRGCTCFFLCKKIIHRIRIWKVAGKKKQSFFEYGYGCIGAWFQTFFCFCCLFGLYLMCFCLQVAVWTFFCVYVYARGCVLVFICHSLICGKCIFLL